MAPLVRGGPPVTDTAVAALVSEALLHHQAGRLGEAEAVYLELLRRDPQHAEASHLLGVVLHQRGDAPAAEIHIRRAIDRSPDNPAYHANLGLVLRAQRRLDEAEACLHRALALDAKQADAHFNLGLILEDKGQLEAALESLRRSADLQPQYMPTHVKIGDLLGRLDRWAEAASAFRTALVLVAAPEIHNRLGDALMRQGRLDEAVASFRHAVTARPTYAAAWNNLGNALHDLGRLGDATQCLQRSIELDGSSAEAWNNMGSLLQTQGQLDEAAAYFQKAIDLAPGLAGAWNNLGGERMTQGRIEEAVAHFRHAVDLDPTFSTAHSNLIFALDLMPGAAFAEQQAERRAWYGRHGKHLRPSLHHANAREPDRRLRIGYVSADFRRHSASACFGPILRHHDPAAVEIVCYSGTEIEDDVTTLLRDSAALWRSTLRIPDQALCDMIRSDGIDILVDLSGHSRGNRLLAFAYKPAPVQVTAWGHATGSGLATMDYFFADPTFVPQEVRRLFAEKIYDLPCVITYEAPSYAPAVDSLSRLDRDAVTFGCLNRLAKVTEVALSVWARILEAVPGSCLMLKDRALDDAATQRQILNALLRNGVAPERVLLRGGTPHVDHLRAYGEIDIALDPFPNSGGITTYETLWMGVPVVSPEGPNAASRLSAAILSAVGLNEWVAVDAEAYVSLAIDKARDREALARLRATLRGQVAGSVAGDPVRYTRAVEDAYRTIWRRWCAGSS